MSGDATVSAAPDSLRSPAAVWKVAAPVAAAVLVAVLLLYWETVAFTVDFWARRRSYGHGLLLVPISLFLVWQNRARLARRTPRPQPWAAPLLIGASLLWGLAHFIDVQLVMQLALLAVIAFALWTLLGNRVGRELAFPVGYLLLGIPIWSLLRPFLQDYTASASAHILSAFGVPVYLEAFYISIPSGQFVVEEVCAGLRYLMATMAIAALFAYLNLRRVRLGIIFFLGCVAFSIVLNWLRVVTIIWVGYITEMQHWLVKDHLPFGWGVFAVGLIPMFAFGIWLQRFDRAPVPASSAPLEQAPAGAPVPRFLLWGALTLVLSSIGPAAVLWSASHTALPAQVHLQAPPAVAPWTRAQIENRTWQPGFVGAAAEVLADYRDNDARVSLYIAYYAHQRDGAEIVSELNRLYDQHAWKARQRSERRVALGDGTAIRLREIDLVSGSGAERVIWYWFRLGPRRTSNVLQAKMLQLWQTLAGSPAAAVVAISAPVRESVDTARAELEAFAATMGTGVAKVITDAGAR